MDNKAGPAWSSERRLRSPTEGAYGCESYRWFHSMKGYRALPGHHASLKGLLLLGGVTGQAQTHDDLSS